MFKLLYILLIGVDIVVYNMTYGPNANVDTWAGPFELHKNVFTHAQSVHLYVMYNTFLFIMFSPFIINFVREIYVMFKNMYIFGKKVYFFFKKDN